MQLGLVIGSATSTVRHPSFTGWRMVILQPLGIERRPEGDPVIAIDEHGAGAGQTVIFNADGRRTREVIGNDKSPARYFVAGLVDAGSGNSQ